MGEPFLIVVSRITTSKCQIAKVMAERVGFAIPPVLKTKDVVENTDAF
jgi:hypothetical protein